jgi:hypothetical protein
MRCKILLVFSSYRSHLRIPRHLGAPSCSNRPNPNTAFRAVIRPQRDIFSAGGNAKRGLARDFAGATGRAVIERVDWESATAARSLAA